MRNAFLVLSLFFTFMSKVSAHTEPGVKPVLRYDETHMQNVPYINSKYLKFVQEEVKFPNHIQKQRFEKALSIIEEVLNSEEFKVKVISYVRASGKREYSQNILWGNSEKRLSNEDIYEIILNGNEKMIQNTLGEMNINSTVRVCKFHERVTSWCRSVVGSTSPHSSKWIELNWKFYSYYETHEMVGNIVHEWLHLIGFLHGNESLHEEVPYVVGEIASEIAKNMLNK